VLDRHHTRHHTLMHVHRARLPTPRTHDGPTVRAIPASAIRWRLFSEGVYMNQAMRQSLESRGFDAISDGRFARPKCSACEVAVINGVACHETGCPNARHECKGCNALVPMRQTYCDDCR
jgi:hypothetical protein